MCKNFYERVVAQFIVGRKELPSIPIFWLRTESSPDRWICRQLLSQLSYPAPAKLSFKVICFLQVTDYNLIVQVNSDEKSVARQRFIKEIFESVARFP